MVDSLPPDEEVFAATLVEKILRLHPEYGNEIAKTQEVVPNTTEDDKKPVQSWMREIRSLFDPSQAPLLDGRHVTLGLALLEPQVRRQLRDSGLMQALAEEITGLDYILSPKGRALYRRSESVPIHTDDPLKKSEEDLLGREAFAEALATRIENIWSGDTDDSGNSAYLIHIYGPWGAGKTTLLNFLGEKLKNEGWSVVPFNAWRHQHIGPPWWSLLENIYRYNKKYLSQTDRLKEIWWRFATGRTHYFLALIFLSWLITLFFFFVSRNLPPEADLLQSLTDTAKALSTIFALVATIWGALLGLNQSLLLGSARAAKNYAELTNDPMEHIKNRFKNLVSRIHKPVAVFIDDLDRCQGTYVVDLLEGIQTLFKEAPVVYVVAADQGWLCASYGEKYKDFKEAVAEPGRPLGYLFLEKAFQTTTPVPGLSERVKKAYWQDLILLEGKKQLNNIKAAREDAQWEFKDAQSEDDVLKILQQSENRPFIEQQALREEAVVRLAIPDVMQHTEHILRDFAPLLETNPRAMKRFVNTYSTNRAIATLARLDIEREKLALWTITVMRWPLFAEFLEEKPKMVELMGQPTASNVPESIQGLFNDIDVINVISGATVGASLDPETIRECAFLRI